MTWRNTGPQREKIKFIGEWLSGEYNFSDLCKRYGISRKTGYKLVNRYEIEQEQAFCPKSHARHHHPNIISNEIRERLIALKHRYPNWGPQKLRDWLILNEGERAWPAVSTIGDTLKKEGLVKQRKYRKKVEPYTEPFSECDESNKVWSADFKGQFKISSSFCYPLTISDNYSRFLLLCKGLERPTLKETKEGFIQTFIEYGLPAVIRTDNGAPFAGLGIGGLSRLSIWWLKLGILPERIDPGHPEQNGRHERMHRTLKEETTLPPKNNFIDQQQCFDEFKNEYNTERPHQSLGGKRPSDVYGVSKRQFVHHSPEVIYPDHFEIRQVRSNGEIKCWGKKYFVSELLCGETIGLDIIEEDKAIIYFSVLKLGVLEARTNKINRLSY